MTIIEMAREMGKLIQESDEYKALMEARTASDNDEELQKQIGEFNLNKAKDVVDHLMNHVTAILTAAVNGEDPATYDPDAACTGDCCSCGGCH